MSRRCCCIREDPERPDQPVICPDPYFVHENLIETFTDYCLPRSAGSWADNNLDPEGWDLRGGSFCDPKPIRNEVDWNGSQTADNYNDKHMPTSYFSKAGTRVSGATGGFLAHGFHLDEARVYGGSCKQMCEIEFGTFRHNHTDKDAAGYPTDPVFRQRPDVPYPAAGPNILYQGMRCSMFGGSVSPSIYFWVVGSGDPNYWTSAHLPIEDAFYRCEIGQNFRGSFGGMEDKWLVFDLPVKWVVGNSVTFRFSVEQTSTTSIPVGPESGFRIGAECKASITSNQGFGSFEGTRTYSGAAGNWLVVSGCPHRNIFFQTNSITQHVNFQSPWPRRPDWTPDDPPTVRTTYPDHFGLINYENTGYCWPWWDNFKWETTGPPPP